MVDTGGSALLGLLWIATPIAMLAHVGGVLLELWAAGAHWTWWVALVLLLVNVGIGLYARLILGRPDAAGGADV